MVGYKAVLMGCEFEVLLKLSWHGWIKDFA